MLPLAGIIFFLASCVVLCFGVVMKILVTQQCVIVLTQSWEGSQRGQLTPGVFQTLWCSAQQ